MNAEASAQRPLIIQGPFLVLVEGKDEKCFFEALLAHMRISAVQLFDIAGKDRLPRLFPAICRKLDRIRSYAIVRDAEDDADNTLKSICGVLKRNGQPCPKASGRFAKSPREGPKVGVFVLPGDAPRGMLEDLCLRTVPDHPAMPCVEAFVACIGQRLPRKDPAEQRRPGQAYHPKNSTKARALAFLAAMHEEAHRVGEAAQQGCWNFDHPSMTLLKSFMAELVS